MTQENRNVNETVNETAENKENGIPTEEILKEADKAAAASAAEKKPEEETAAADGSTEEASDDAQEETAAEQEAEKEPQTKEKRFFKKKEKKDKKDEKIEELTDRLTRQLAEFDNYRKRTEKEKASMYTIGAKDIVEKILPVVDNFERGLATVEHPEDDPFAEGMNKIYKQLVKTLEDMGVTVIEAVGQEFDPNLHNAVMHVEDEEAGENIIVEEFLKGYKYKDIVVRHSMVKVAN